MSVSTGFSIGRVRSTYAFIQAQRCEHSVENDVPRARSGPERLLRVAQEAGLESRLGGCSAASTDPGLVRGESRYLRGAARLPDLREAGETCSKHRVARLMRVNNLRALDGYRIQRWAVGKPAVLIPNLLQRQFTVPSPNKAWVTDLTYIRTWQAGCIWPSSWICSPARSFGPPVPRSTASSSSTPCSWRCAEDDHAAP